MNRIIFISGTRADYGKIKILIEILHKSKIFQVNIFVTGMHLLLKYGSTYKEIEKNKIGKIYKFINQNENNSMSEILAKTIAGFSDYIYEIKPDLIICHGDRIEALAAAIVGTLNNIPVAHIEGGEVSGTVDEIIRHSISKIANIHFTSNYEAKKRLLQLGEKKSHVHVIGSPDLDILMSNKLPSIALVRKRYELKFKEYAILLFHPVTTEINLLENQCAALLRALIKSQLNYLVIFPNNDSGSNIIFEGYKKLKANEKFKFIPSMRFEYFLTALKNSLFIIGNSSAGIREAPYFGIPTINLGSRQNNRTNNKLILNTNFNENKILNCINKSRQTKNTIKKPFGTGLSGKKFLKVLSNEKFWKKNTQKSFVDLNKITTIAIKSK
ncbi:UDP-N-acetylglucosamine 2-epimerase (hydrolyzing) [Candidatus Methylopumilus universalis]|jgi:UDP-N-acetylglucosamine 2-epimerase (hydrolysing)|uniref:UDP-N-acetylglucosamine 2-epimerase n=1 Tax=Candidatus Methylopumilus universalis TaxID=2588536 RepID=UPI00111DC684|nr:UDP-N-acetylglucosamine 2-epimerase [Candidatus Methylopumilus universalis]QDC70754.1 UDP-N-acetylglucosamine 2-epimerase (hydrolyzing) [Candidatus Methylopumilus universalis]